MVHLRRWAEKITMNAHDVFVKAIHDKKKVRIAFFSHEDRCELTRVCAPWDFGVFKRYKDKIERYLLWDYESEEGPHILPIRKPDLHSAVELPEQFDPRRIENIDKPGYFWLLPRQW